MVDGKDELKKKLREKLKEIFQFESENLDFGIYRIVNYKRNEIREFIEKELIKEVRKKTNDLEWEIEKFLSTRKDELLFLF